MTDHCSPPCFFWPLSELARAALMVPCLVVVLDILVWLAVHIFVGCLIGLGCYNFMGKIGCISNIVLIGSNVYIGCTFCHVGEENCT